MKHTECGVELRDAAGGPPYAFCMHGRAYSLAGPPAIESASLTHPRPAPQRRPALATPTPAQMRRGRLQTLEQDLEVEELREKARRNAAAVPPIRWVQPDSVLVRRGRP